MSNDESITRVDMGNIDWLVMEHDGRLWISPSISWQDGEVYESLRDGQDLLYTVLESATLGWDNE